MATDKGMCAKGETANPLYQRLMRGILTAFRAWRPDSLG